MSMCCTQMKWGTSEIKWMIECSKGCKTRDKTKSLVLSIQVVVASEWWTERRRWGIEFAGDGGMTGGKWMKVELKQELSSEGCWSDCWHSNKGYYLDAIEVCERAKIGMVWGWKKRSHMRKWKEDRMRYLVAAEDRIKEENKRKRNLTKNWNQK